MTQTRKKNTGEATNNGGEFGSVVKSESGVTLPTASSITPAEVEVLVEHRGSFEDGYDDEDITYFASGFKSVEFGCVWEYRDASGCGGDSEIVVREVLSDDGSRGPWCRPDADTYEFLTNKDSDTDPESIKSFIGEPYDGADPESLNVINPYNFATTDEELCRADECDESLDDGEGYDGYCGTHADKVANHEEGAHEEAPDDDCPEC